MGLRWRLTPSFSRLDNYNVKHGSFSLVELFLGFQQNEVLRSQLDERSAAETGRY